MAWGKRERIKGSKWKDKDRKEKEVIKCFSNKFLLTALSTPLNSGYI